MSSRTTGALAGLIIPRARLVVGGCLALAVGCASLGNYYGPRAEVLVEEDVDYVGDGAESHRLDLYLPKDAKQFPTVVFVHGGWWAEQDRRHFQSVVGLYGNIGVALARRGVAVANIDYRLYPEARLEDMLGDVTAAVRFVHREIGARGGDPETLFLAGHSAGGHLVALLGADPQELATRDVEPAWIRGVAALSPPLSMANVVQYGDPEKVASIVRPLFGNDTSSLAHASPRERMSPRSLPLLILVGERDLRGITTDYDELQTNARSIGVDVRFEKIPDADHGDVVLQVGTPEDLVTEPVVSFLLDHAPLVTKGAQSNG